ncbi:hypothetical protein ES703_35211 [subsurface metagenome]
MNRITVTIPTYWCRKAGEAGRPEDSVFDHPTPINREGTLRRCLESLLPIRAPSFQVLIITAPVNQGLAAAVEEKIESIISPFRKSLSIAQFGPPDLALVKRELEKEGIDPALVSLDAYAQIRNCQLLGSVLLDTDLIAAIDDDEVVPEDYLAKAGAFAGKQHRGRRIHGVAGIYLNSEGDYRLKEAPAARSSSNLFKRKAALMNDEFSSYMDRPERIVDTAVALGGNMIFSRDLFWNVPFDPGITRGEDIDYLLNSRMLRFNWVLDKELSITHLPPPPSEEEPLSSSPYSKLQQDIMRFIYQREKLKFSSVIDGLEPLRLEEFGCYPGEFFKDYLEEHALEALREMRPEDADEGFFPKPEEWISKARERAGRTRFFIGFREKWQQVVGLAAESRLLKEHLQRKFDPL